LVRELTNRRFQRAHALLAHSLVDAAKMLQAVVNPGSVPAGLATSRAWTSIGTYIGDASFQKDEAHSTGSARQEWTALEPVVVPTWFDSEPLVPFAASTELASDRRKQAIGHCQRT